MEAAENGRADEMLELLNEGAHIEFKSLVRRAVCACVFVSRKLWLIVAIDMALKHQSILFRAAVRIHCSDLRRVKRPH